MMTLKERLRYLWDDETGCISIAMAIVLAASASSTATTVYSVKKASEAEKARLGAQKEEATEAQTLERESMAFKEKARQENLALEKARWADYVRVHTPYWRTGEQVLGSLYNMAGYGGAPQFAFPSPTSPPPSGGPGGSVVAGAGVPWAGSPVAGRPTGRVASPYRRVIGPPIPMPRPSTFASLQDMMLLATMPSGPAPIAGRPPAVPVGQPAHWR